MGALAVSRCAGEPVPTYWDSNEGPRSGCRHHPPRPLGTSAPCPRHCVFVPAPLSATSSHLPAPSNALLGRSRVPELDPFIPIYFKYIRFFLFSPGSVFAINTAQAQADEKTNHSYENNWLCFKKESQQVQQQPFYC